MDVKGGYHQMPVKDSDKELTSFIVPWGQFEWKRGCPFGLSGAPSSFQCMMTAILGECLYTDALCYLDDIIIWSTSWQEHLSKLEKVLKKLQNVGMLLAPSKCTFGSRSVHY